MASCCKFRVNPNRAPLFGVLIVSAGLGFFGGGLFFLLVILSRCSKGLRGLRARIGLLLKANNQVVNDNFLSPRYRCWISGKLFHLSPPLAGMIFKHFNLSVLLLCWVGAIILLWNVIVFLG